MKTKALKKTTSFITVFFILLSFVSCTFRPNDDPSDSQSSTEAPDHSASSVQDKPSREPLGYSRLNKTQREIYDIIKSGTIVPGSTLEFDTPKDYTDVMKSIKYYNIDCSNNCAIHYFETQYSVEFTDEFLSENPYTDFSYNVYMLYGITEKGDFVPLRSENSVKGIYAQPSFTPDWFDSEQMKADFEKESAEWMKELPSDDASNFEKAFALAELMCRKIKYAGNDFASSPYGAVVVGEAVCDGYARAFQYFSRLIGLESIYVTGAAGSDAESLEGHAWNMVNIDGGWYHIDVTWMDRENAVPDLAYFLKSDEHMLENRHDFNHFLYEENNERNAEILEKEFPLPRAKENYNLTELKKWGTQNVEILFDACIKNAGSEQETKSPTDKKCSMTLQFPLNLISNKNYSDDEFTLDFFYVFEEKNQSFFTCSMISNVLFWVEDDYVLDDTVCSLNNGVLMPTTEFTLTGINGIPAAVYHELQLDYYDIYLRISDNYIAFMQISTIDEESNAQKVYNYISKNLTVTAE